MTALGRILARLIGATTFVGMIAVALMMAHITADVIGKFLFNAPIPATIALVSNYYMVLLAFMPLAYAESRRAHISVEVLTELFPRRAQHHLYSWTHLLSALVFALLTYRTWQEALTNHAMGTFAMEQSTKMITWPSYYILPIGCGLMTLVVLYRFAVYVTGAKDGIGDGIATTPSPDD